MHTRAGTLPHPRIARAYRNLLLDAGFSDVSVEVHTLVFTDQAMLPVPVAHATAARQAGAITGDEADKWIGEQTRRAREDRLLVAIPMFLAAGTFFPVTNLPEGIRTVALGNPLYHCVQLVRDASLEHLVLADLGHAGVLLAFALLMWRLAVWRLGSRLID